MISIGRLRLLTDAVGSTDGEPLGRRFVAALQRELRTLGGPHRLRIDELVLDAPGRDAAPDLWAREAARVITQRAKVAPPPQPSPAAQGREFGPATAKSFSPPPRAGEGQGGGEQRLTANTATSKARHGG